MHISKWQLNNALLGMFIMTRRNNFTFGPFNLSGPDSKDIRRYRKYKNKLILFIYYIVWISHEEGKWNNSHGRPRKKANMI